MGPVKQILIQDAYHAANKSYIMRCMLKTYFIDVDMVCIIYNNRARTLILLFVLVLFSHAIQILFHTVCIEVSDAYMRQ